MRLFLGLILQLLLAGKMYGQTTVKGVVTDTNSDPVPGANILLEDTYDGTSSDSNGRFSFTTEESGPHILIIRFVGYKTVRQAVQLDGSEVVVNVLLAEAINQLDAVTISAGNFTAGDEGRRTVFRAVDIATTAGATADIAGALNTLPGTQKVGETGRLFVRGGEGREAKTFIDGMLVHDAYGPAAPNTPSRGRFLPFMFKGTSFSTGGYSAEYGQALSSALVLDSKDESETTRTDLGLLSVGGDVAQTIAWDQGSVAAKIQYTNIRPYFNLINQEIDWKTPPASLEGVSAFRQRVGKSGIVKAYGNFSQSSFSLYRHDLDDANRKELYDLENKYRYINGYYRGSLNENWLIRAGLSYSHIRNAIGLDVGGQLEIEHGLHAKTVIEGSPSQAIGIKTGVEVMQRKYDEQLVSPDNQRLQRDFEEWISSFFTEVEIYLSNKFVTRTGGRVEFDNLTGALGIDPRISLAYRTGRAAQVSFAYGIFRQAVSSEYVKIKRNVENEKAEHFILNYQYIRNNRTFRAETFYKRYDHLVKFTDEQLPGTEGSGYARGFELFWRDNRSVKNLDYWVSWSWLDTERDYLDFPVRATPAYASAHNFSAVGKYFITAIKSQLGITYSFTSGRPYNNPNEDGFNAFRTPSYQDLSFNWSYLPKPQLIIYFSCTNVLGRDNIFGYEYSSAPNENGHYNGRAIRQPAPRFLFIGIFLTLSKDKSMTQLPTL